MRHHTAISPPDLPMRGIEHYAEQATAEQLPSPEDLALASGEPPHSSSLTAIAAESLRTGLYPMKKEEQVPHEDELLQAGDPDVDPLQSLYSGDVGPGGSMPGPDENNVDDIGRLVAMEDEDNGSLRMAEELAERRDILRWDKEALSPKN